MSNQSKEKCGTCDGSSILWPEGRGNPNRWRHCPECSNPPIVCQPAGDYALADSGERRSFSTGAQRDRARGKGRPSLLSPFAQKRKSIVAEKGAEKYHARNCELGMPIGEYMDSAMRHIADYLAGLTNEDHLAQAAWNLDMALHTEELIRAGILGPEMVGDLHIKYHEQYNEFRSKELAAEAAARKETT